jgi:hypothetical protein
VHRYPVLNRGRVGFALKLEGLRAFPFIWENKIMTYKTDQKIIMNIVARANRETLIGIDGLTLAMDLTAVHEANPLRLDDLLKAEPLPFWHDITGITRYINREAGEAESIFEDFFLPRFTA